MINNNENTNGEVEQQILEWGVASVSRDVINNFEISALDEEAAPADPASWSLVRAQQFTDEFSRQLDTGGDLSVSRQVLCKN